MALDDLEVEARPGGVEMSDGTADGVAGSCEAGDTSVEVEAEQAARQKAAARTQTARKPAVSDAGRN